MLIGILLAAGSSRRFGSDKLIQSLPNGQFVAIQAYNNLRQATDQVLVVVKPDNQSLITQLQSADADIVLCLNTEQGMGNSLACGIRASLEAKGWVIALADMPWIKPGTIKQITNELNSGAAIIAPIWQGQRGHPVGFSAIFGSELAQLQGDTGAKSLIQANIHHLKLIDCNDPGILQDIDYPADLIK